MADDQNQRPFRSNPTPARNAPGASVAGNDPLAELARLIGQSDPFGEYGRQNTAQRPAAQQPAAAPAYAQPAGNQRYAQAPLAPPPEMHPAEYVPPTYEAGVPGYDDQAGEYAHDAYYADGQHGEGERHDYYDDVPPRRRMGVMAIAAVFALAVVGTAGAFGYRAIFGSSGSSGPPPVIKADTSPSKIVPEKKDAKNGKLIYDRVADHSQSEKLVSREEQPVDINDKPAGVVMPPAQNGMPSGSIQPPLGSGVVGTEPKKIHTIAIRPDGTVMADAGPSEPATTLAAPAPAAMPAPAPAATTAAQPPPAKPEPHRTVARAEPPAHYAAAPSARNAPLSLSPNAGAQPAHRVERPIRTAAVGQPTQIEPARAVPTRATPTAVAPASGGGYAVQIVSRHNQADAQASFHSLQAKYPQQLGGRRPLIRRVDLGAKGIYYRAMVGPFGSAEEASHMCSSLKAAGGSCFVQRI